MSNKTLRQLAYPLITVLALGAVFAAHAEDGTIDNSASQAWSSAKSRAQVQAELFAARADGSIKVYSISYNPLAVAKSEATREEVKAALAVSRVDGTHDMLTGEDSGSFHFASVQRAPQAVRILAQAK